MIFDHWAADIIIKNPVVIQYKTAWGHESVAVIVNIIILIFVGHASETIERSLQVQIWI